MPARVSFGFEGCPHQLIEEFRGQECPSLGQSPIGNLLAGELFHVLSQRASFGYDMKDQALDQFDLRDLRRPAATHAATNKERINQGPGEQFIKEDLKRFAVNRSFVLPPQGNGELSTKVQGKNCLVPTICSLIPSPNS
jgi:hypothetical protein